MSKPSEYQCNPQVWVKLYADELFRFALFRLNSHELAEDLVQETFLSALDNLKNFRRDCTEKTWLYNILKNKIIDHYRKNDKKKISMIESIQQTDNEHFYQNYFLDGSKNNRHWKAETAPKHWEMPADNSLLHEEFMQILKECLSFLPDLQADVFRLKNIEELTTNEICKELSISASNLWVLIHRAKLQLRDCLEKKGMNNE